MVAENIANIRWAIQTAQGTPSTVGVYGAFLAGGSVIGATGTNEDFEETTSARIRSDRYAAERHAAGAPEFYVMPNGIASLLYGALGAVVTTGAGDPYTHTITAVAAGTALPWFTFWRSQSGLLFEESSDCKITQLVLSGESNRPLRVAATIEGLRTRSQTAEEGTPVSVETTNRFLHYDGDGALLLEGAAVASIRAFTLTINNNAAAVPGDSLAPTDISEGQLQISLAVTKLLVDYSVLNRLYYGAASPSNNTEVVTTLLELAGSPAGAQFTFTRVAAAPGPARDIVISLPRLTVDPYQVQPGLGSAPLTEELMLQALEPAGATEPITAVVRNGLADLNP